MDVYAIVDHIWSDHDLDLLTYAVVKLWLHVKYNYLEIILKLSQCFISRVTTDGGDIQSNILNYLLAIDVVILQLITTYKKKHIRR